MILTTLFWFLFAGIVPFAYGQDALFTGNYFFKNYSKGEYHAHSQNWDIHQDTTSGIIYIGNNQGLLSFDGTRWQSHPLPSRLPMRAVMSNHQGKVFVGGYEEFGFFDIQATGTLEYISLSDSLPQKIGNNEEIWQITQQNGAVLFQSFTAIYEYDKGRLTTHTGPSYLLYLMSNKGKLAVHLQDMGLYAYDHGDYQLMEGGATFKDSRVIAWFSLGTDEIAGTTLDGLYKKAMADWEYWKCEASDFLEKNQLNRSVQLNDSTMMFGTIKDGAIVVNQKGEILEHLNMSQGINNNTILSMLYDMDHNVWLGLDNGLTYVKTASPFRYIADISGQLGASYDATLFGEYLYIGTNHGLFYTPLHPNNTAQRTFTFVEGTQGQVWDLSIHDNQLFCGHNNGTYIIDQPGSMPRLASTVAGGWSLKVINSDWMVQGTYVGLAFYQKDARGQWYFSHHAEGLPEPLRFVAVHSQDVLWASHNQKGVYKVILDPTHLELKRVVYYGKEAGFPEDYNIHVFTIRGRIVFTTATGIYTYDEINDAIVPFEKINQQLTNFKGFYRIIEVDRDQYWFISSNRALLFQIDSEFNLTEVSRFMTPGDLIIENYENIGTLGHLSSLTMDNGLVLFSNEALTNSSKEKHRIRLSQVVAETNNARRSSQLSTDSTQFHTLAANQNNIRFTFTNASYDPLPHSYQVQLKGLEQNWSAPQTTGHQSYNNLRPGTYDFYVRLSAQPTSETRLYQFRIKKPWYLTNWAIAGYVALVLALLKVSFLLHSAHLQKQKEELESEKQQALQHLKMLSEQRIMTIEKDRLEQEVLDKSHEISSSALRLSNKNQLLEALKEGIIGIKKAPETQKPAIAKLVRLIDSSLTNNDDWILFETNFNHINSKFYEHLSEKHPHLSSNDLRFCAFLKMNLSTKELAALLNVSVRSLELKRYRLRKKLDLSHEENLIDFLLSIDS
jgi:hypothetical protein